MAKKTTGTGRKSTKSGKHADAAQKAAGLAAKMVATNANIEAFKRVIVRNQAVQNRLATTTSPDDFINSAVQLAGEHGLPFTAAQARNHLKRLQETSPSFVAMSSEIDPNPGGGGGSGGGGGCGSSGTISNASYSLQCGLSTQKCLCTI